MKRQVFRVPGSLFIERTPSREGPSPVWICWKPHTSRVFADPKAAIKFAAWPKSTPTGQELRDWIKGLEEPVAVSTDQSRIKAEGWGPEAHAAAEEPNDNTKMIT